MVGVYIEVEGKRILLQKKFEVNEMQKRIFKLSKKRRAGYAGDRKFLTACSEEMVRAVKKKSRTFFDSLAGSLKNFAVRGREVFPTCSLRQRKKRGQKLKLGFTGHFTQQGCSETPVKSRSCGMTFVTPDVCKYLIVFIFMAVLRCLTNR